jgi:hypothetical protein
MRMNLIDDVKCTNWADELGMPILFDNPSIRKMLRLAGAGEGEVFYDLGSGWGQNLIVAAAEFGVKLAVGVEENESRYKKSFWRRKNWAQQHPEEAKRMKVLRGDFDELLEGGRNKDILKDATIVFLGLSSSKKLIDEISERLTDGARLVYYYYCLIPEILPNQVDFPFYVSVKPFTKPRHELEWLSAIVPKPHSSLHKGKPTPDELWSELTHDYRVNTRGSTDSAIVDYKERLKDATQSTAG